MRRTTYRIVIPWPTAKEMLAVIACLIVALVVLWALIDVVLPAVGFDGKIGPGCDHGNPNCVKPTPGEKP